ncbi:MAG: methionyl-tRNA formyltransferase [bacterium]|nr:methionyl-tRNA formyltransferase [bacterium]
MNNKQRTMDGNKLNIVFFGTPEFSATILETLIKHNLKPVLVVTAPDKPVGRSQIMTPPPVKVLAEKREGILVLQPESLDSPDFKKVLENIQPDLIVLAAYGPPFLGKMILEMPEYGCINLHPSLLPKYRGASPIPYAILNGEEETGVTVIRMSEKIDQGDILAQEKLSILPSDTTKTLTEKLAVSGGHVLVKTIELLPKGLVLPRSQGDSSTPYCYQLKKEDGKIDWQKPAEFIERQIRAFDPWPGTFTKINGKILKILKVHAITDKMSDISPRAIKESAEPKDAGFVFLNKDKELVVQTGKDSLAIEQLQIEGGKPMASEEFLKGHRGIIGEILG